jgi:hypothetical protein
MPIDLRNEEVLSLAEVTKLACFQRRRGGKRLNVATVWRWCSTGVKGVVLETVMLGGTRATSVEAVERFVDTLTIQQAHQRPAPQPTRTTAQRTKAIEAAERRLAAAGI